MGAKKQAPTSVEFVPRGEATRVEVAVPGSDDTIVITSKGYSSRDHGIIRSLDELGLVKRSTVTTITEAQEAGLPAPPREEEQPPPPGGEGEAG